jgi:hypothetical protein
LITGNHTVKVRPLTNLEEISQSHTEMDWYSLNTLLQANFDVTNVRGTNASFRGNHFSHTIAPYRPNGILPCITPLMLDITPTFRHIHKWLSGINPLPTNVPKSEHFFVRLAFLLRLAHNYVMVCLLL